MKTNHKNYIKLAFNLAKQNLGKTNLNPSVGCVVVKNNAVISSGVTSKNGRPHAEFNALNKKINISKSDLYLTMEPCTHYGMTPPCTNLIIKKKIKRVFFAFHDVDKRTAKKSKRKLLNNHIQVFKKKEKLFKDFYESYFLVKKKSIPMIDAKIAISKDFFTINKNSKWITNLLSRKRAHLIRSQYDGIISTSKSINQDNSLLNCRIDGFDKKKPDLIIIDLKLKIRKKLKIFQNKSQRKIILVTLVSDSKKINFLKQKRVNIIQVKSLKNKRDFISLFKILKKYRYSRILVESGLTFLNSLLKDKLINNIFIFKSALKLGKKGKNNASNKHIKKFKLIKPFKVNLDDDKIFKVKI